MIFCTNRHMETFSRKIFMRYELQIRRRWEIPEPKKKFTIVESYNSENCTQNWSLTSIINNIHFLLASQ